MEHYIPYVRTDIEKSSAEEIEAWLGVDKFLAISRMQSQDVEFQLLVEFLAEFSGNVELAYQRMVELLTDQAAMSYQAHHLALKKIKQRVYKLYKEAVNKPPGEASRTGPQGNIIQSGG